MLNQKLQLKLSQKLSPQQIQLMKLIQLSTLEFEQRLSREIEENPALDTVNDNNEIEKDEFDFDENNERQESSDDEIDISDYLTDDDIPEYNLRTNNYSEENEKAIPYAAGTSFNQFLKNQLHSFSFKDEELKIAEFILGSLDQFGYLRRELIDISDDLAFTMGFNDDAIVKISPDGEILFEKSVSQIFIDNGLEYLLFSVEVGFLSSGCLKLIA